MGTLSEIVKVVIPSHKRADRVVTKSAIVRAIICVPKSQESEYREHNPECEIVTHPDTVVGLPPKLQWIYTHFGNVFCLDDDLKAMCRMYLAHGDPTPFKIKPDTAWDIVQSTAATARELGAYLFGFAMTAQPTFYSPMNPFRLTGYVNSFSMGLLSGGKLFFDQTMRTGGDYFVSLINAYHHRYCFVDSRFAFMADSDATFCSPGGLAEFRTVDEEKRTFEHLRKCFGECIQLKGRKAAYRKGTKGERRHRHPYERSIKLPY